MNSKKYYFSENNLKLNLGCGKDIKEGFINIDSEEKQGVDIDIIADLSHGIPIHTSTSSFIYSSHMIEHLNWNDGISLLKECYRCLQFGGKLRLLFPDFKKIMKAYVDNDKEFFSDILNYLNNDYLYYKSMLNEPDRVIQDRKDNLPPSWHYSKSSDDRYKVALRARKYNHLIECVDWFVHQYGEHVSLYDYSNIEQLLSDVGFSKVEQSEYDSKIDASHPIRIKTSSYIIAYK